MICFRLKVETIIIPFRLIPIFLCFNLVQSPIEYEQEKNRELKNALTDSIALLKERRSALVTAAVTGQIGLMLKSS